MSRPYELLIFDWDGTLMDSIERIVQCMQLAFREARLPAPGDAAVRAIIGLGMQESLDRLLPGGSPGQQQALIDAYRRHWVLGEEQPCVLFNGVAPVLQALNAADYLLAIATGKARRGLDAALSGSGIATHIHFSRCADETRSKPHPLMLEELLEVTGLEAHQALMIGDTIHDMELAANAGVPALAVTWGVDSAERLQSTTALGSINHIQQLPGWLRQQSASRTRGRPDE